MVRVKHRYLVAQILYPEPPKTTTTNSNPTSNSAPKPPSTTNLSFHRPTPPAITSAHLLRLIREAISDLFGDAGAGLCAASLAVKYFSPATSTLIIRCARERAHMVWAALLFVGRLPVVIEGGRHCGGRNASNAISGGGRGGGNGGGDGLPCIVRVVHQSGTIRKSQEKIIELARRDIVRFGMTGAGGVSLNDALDGIVGMANDGDESEEIGEGDDDDEDEDME